MEWPSDKRSSPLEEALSPPVRTEGSTDGGGGWAADRRFPTTVLLSAAALSGQGRPRDAAAAAEPRGAPRSGSPGQALPKAVGCGMQPPPGGRLRGLPPLRALPKAQLPAPESRRGEGGHTHMRREPPGLSARLCD